MDIAEQIKQATVELAIENFNARQKANREQIWVIEEYLKTADLESCLRVLNDLTDRVVELVGLAPELEDAAVSIIKELENQQ